MTAINHNDDEAVIERQPLATIRCSGSPSCACPWHYPEGWKPEPACIVDDEGGVCGRDDCSRCGADSGRSLPDNGHAIAPGSSDQNGSDCSGSET